MSDEFLKYSTAALHGDADVREWGDVAPPIHVTTITEYEEDPAKLFVAGTRPRDPSRPAPYSRIGHQNTERVEAVLEELLDGPSVLYSSGLSAFHGIISLLNPKRVFIGKGYHGIHGVAHILQRTGLQLLPLEEIDGKIEKGDVVHLETPVNPTGLALDIELYAKKAHDAGAKLIVDATFAPPPLLHPFQHGADYILHSASKYLSGHSDILAGVITTKDTEFKKQLVADRAFIGTILPPFEAWLLLRSLKTLPIRLRVQSENVNKIVQFLSENKSKLPKLAKIYHSNLQTEDFVKKQYPLGGSPTFAIEVSDEETAKALPNALKLFYHSTSLGSVHSLIEWRAITDPDVSTTLLRISVGIEGADDLINDLAKALK